MKNSPSNYALAYENSYPLDGRRRWLDVEVKRPDAMLRVHQSIRRPAQPVLMETEVIDAAGAIVHTSPGAIAADAFAAGDGVEHRFELPLATFGPGDYLLRFVATAGPTRVQRDIRFSVGQ